MSEKEIEEEEGKREKKAEEKASRALGLRKHTLERVMIELEKISKTLDRIERKLKDKPSKKEE